MDLKLLFFIILGWVAHKDGLSDLSLIYVIII